MKTEIVVPKGLWKVDADIMFLCRNLVKNCTAENKETLSTDI